MGEQVTRLLVATTPMEFETMRQIRNQVRDFMTRDNRHLEPSEQQAWARDLPSATIPYLLVRMPATTLGYGIRRWDPDQRWWWLTGALLEQYRGQRYGQQLFELLIAEAAPEPTALEVKITNLPARKLYEKLGYVQRQQRADILVLTREN